MNMKDERKLTMAPRWWEVVLVSLGHLWMKRCLLILLLTTVAANAQPKPAQLIGHWRTADPHFSCDIMFAADGTFSGHIQQNGAVVSTFAGKWSLSGDNLDYIYTKSSPQDAPLRKDRDRLIEVTKDYYVVEAYDGNRRKYSRIR